MLQKNKNPAMLNKKKNIENICAGCGRNIKSKNIKFCPSCGRDIYTPVIEKKWHYKVVAIIFITLIVLYLIYLKFKPVLYFYLDKV